MYSTKDTVNKNRAYIEIKAKQSKLKQKEAKRTKTNQTQQTETKRSTLKQNEANPKQNETKRRETKRRETTPTPHSRNLASALLSLEAVNRNVIQGAVDGGVTVAALPLHGDDPLGGIEE